MILPLGELSAEEIEALVADWENLIVKAYKEREIYKLTLSEARKIEEKADQE